MGRPKLLGQQSQDLKPDNAQINFAVPSRSVLYKSDHVSLEIPKRLEPGCLNPILDQFSSSHGESYMLCADGKKVTAGLDKHGGGDVDMFGHEDGETLTERKTKLALDL